MNNFLFQFQIYFDDFIKQNKMDIYLFRKQFDRRLDEIEALLTENRI